VKWQWNRKTGNLFRIEFCIIHSKMLFLGLH
jgi:hypothetical protein